MLAKVVKQTANASITTFSFPEIGGASTAIKNGEQFVVPELNSLESVVRVNRAPRTETLAEFETVSTEKLSAQADEIIENAKREAARIIAEADANAENFARAAEEKAVLDVKARFDEEVAARADDARAELTATIEKISSLGETICLRHEKDLVRLALTIAKKVVAREVTIDREIAFTLVKVSLAKLHDRAVAEVHLSPEDFAYVQSHREKLDFRGSLDLVEDRSVSVGGCLIHTESGDIDARIESQFEEIAHGLMQ